MVVNISKSFGRNVSINSTIDIMCKQHEKYIIFIIYIFLLYFTKVIIYFMRIVKEMITHRQMNDVTRNDIMQVLMDLRHKKIQEDTPFAIRSQDVPSEVNDIGK